MIKENSNRPTRKNRGNTADCFGNDMVKEKNATLKMINAAEIQTS
jgi:hypothetical protein